MAKYTEDDLRKIKPKNTKLVFIQILNKEDFPVGLNEEIVRMISAKKKNQMDDQLAFVNLSEFGKMEEPDWGKY